MKIAVISDIHGNMQALEAVLDDILSENCEKILCLGDLAMAGPQPAEAVEKIIRLQDEGSMLVIQGNTDEMIGADSNDVIAKVKAAFPIMGDALENDCKILPPELKNYLKTLPPQLSLELEGVKILMVHGSPRKNDENITDDLSIEKVEEIIADTDASLILCGHTHVPCGYFTTKGQTVVNAGSVGRPFTENAKACYLLMELQAGKFELIHKFIEYDRQKAAQILQKRDFRNADKLATVLLKPELRHM